MTANFFWFTSIKKNALFFFQKWTKKKLTTKNMKLLLVMWRFLNYTKFHYSFIDRNCRKLWQSASLWGGGGGALWAILGSHSMPTYCLKIAPSYPPSLPPYAYIKERQQQPPSTPKITSTLILPVTYKGDGISASKRARELILGSNWGKIQFSIHWCTLPVWWPHQGRTLPVERSPLSA